MDNRKRTKSEVETRNGNGRIDKSKRKKHHRCSVYSRMPIYTYIRIDVYTCCAILVLKYKKIGIYTIHILFGFTNIYNIPHEKISTLLLLDIPFLT